MTELSNTFVCLMGVGTVFFGLICIILICMMMSFICSKLAKPEPAPANVTVPTPAVSKTKIANRQEFIAAVSAAIAEELGKDVSAIKILSVKEL